jgi:hypothetical protein
MYLKEGRILLKILGSRFAGLSYHDKSRYRKSDFLLTGSDKCINLVHETYYIHTHTHT